MERAVQPAGLPQHDEQVHRGPRARPVLRRDGRELAPHDGRRGHVDPPADPGVLSVSALLRRRDRPDGAQGIRPGAAGAANKRGPPRAQRHLQGAWNERMVEGMAVEVHPDEPARDRHGRHRRGALRGRHEGVQGHDRHDQHLGDHRELPDKAAVPLPEPLPQGLEPRGDHGRLPQGGHQGHRPHRLFQDPPADLRDAPGLGLRQRRWKDRRLQGRRARLPQRRLPAGVRPQDHRGDDHDPGRGRDLLQHGRLQDQRLQPRVSRDLPVRELQEAVHGALRPAAAEGRGHQGPGLPQVPPVHAGNREGAQGTRSTPSSGRSGPTS